MLLWPHKFLFHICYTSVFLYTSIVQWNEYRWRNECIEKGCEGLIDMSIEMFVERLMWLNQQVNRLTFQFLAVDRTLRRDDDSNDGDVSSIAVTGVNNGDDDDDEEEEEEEEEDEIYNVETFRRDVSLHLLLIDQAIINITFITCYITLH